MSPPFDKKPYAIIVFIYFMQVVYLCTYKKKIKDRQAVFFVFRHKTHPFKINLFLNLSYLELHYLLCELPVRVTA